MEESTAAASPVRAFGEYRRVPPERRLREEIRRRAEGFSAQAAQGEWLSRRSLEAAARELLAELRLPEDFLGWTMVAIATAFWRPQVMGVPFERRLVLLPHCMHQSSACQGHYTAEGLICRHCGGCPLGELAGAARKLGCTVLIAEGSPAVARLILEGAADAVLGVACLQSLEKVFDRLIAAGLPAMAVPLVVDGCRHTQTDVDWAWEMIHTPYVPQAERKATFVEWFRAVRALFRPERLELLLSSSQDDGDRPRLKVFGGTPPGERDAEHATADIAWEFLLQGGKFFRPLLTMAAYAAIAQGKLASAADAVHIESWPLPVLKVAVAVEIFHKASLVHDDIEDGDLERYGVPTVHARYGVPVALNVGDYLIGQGYRLLTSLASEVSPQTLLELWRAFTDAHIRLCEGQGAELWWRDRVEEFSDPAAAVRIYALKTAPALEVALWAGVVLGGSGELSRSELARMCRHLGVAYQIQNDLDEWVDSGPLARTPGADGFRLRPTLLWAFAARASGPADTARRVALWRTKPPSAELSREVRQWFEETGAFVHAQLLLEKSRERFRQLVTAVGSAELRGLLLRVEELLFA